MCQHHVSFSSNKASRDLKITPRSFPSSLIWFHVLCMWIARFQVSLSTVAVVFVLVFWCFCLNRILWCSHNLLVASVSPWNQFFSCGARYNESDAFRHRYVHSNATDETRANYDRQGLVLHIGKLQDNNRAFVTKPFQHDNRQENQRSSRDYHTHSRWKSQVASDKLAIGQRSEVGDVKLIAFISMKISIFRMISRTRLNVRYAGRTCYLNFV